MSDPMMVICRRASDPLLPGYARGYQCKVCGLDLTASPIGVQYLRREGAIAMCNACGLAMTERLMKAPDGPTVEVHITPAAQDRMREQGLDPEDFVRKKP